MEPNRPNSQDQPTSHSQQLAQGKKKFSPESSSSSESGPVYSPVPKKRRGYRRATGGSTFTGAEPKLAGLTDSSATAQPVEKDKREAWLKEQRPPHYGQ